MVCRSCKACRKDMPCSIGMGCRLGRRNKACRKVRMYSRGWKVILVWHACGRSDGIGRYPRMDLVVVDGLSRQRNEVWMCRRAGCAEGLNVLKGRDVQKSPMC